MRRRLTTSVGIAAITKLVNATEVCNRGPSGDDEQNLKSQNKRIRNCDIEISDIYQQVVEHSLWFFITVQAMKAKRRNAWSLKLSLANGLIECGEIGLPTFTLKLLIDSSSIDALDTIPPPWARIGFDKPSELELFGGDK